MIISPSRSPRERTIATPRYGTLAGPSIHLRRNSKFPALLQREIGKRRLSCTPGIASPKTLRYPAARTLHFFPFVHLPHADRPRRTSRICMPRSSNIITRTATKIAVLLAQCFLRHSLTLPCVARENTRAPPSVLSEQCLTHRPLTGYPFEIRGEGGDRIVVSRILCAIF